MFTLTLSKREKKTARTKKKIKIKTKLNGQPHFQAPSDEGAFVLHEFPNYIKAVYKYEK